MIGPGWAFVVGAPVALAFLVADLRAGRPVRRVLAAQVAAVHVAIVVALTLLPLPVTEAGIAAARDTVASDHNATPLATLARQLAGGVSPFELRNLVGNALLLLPLGLYAPMRSNLWRTAGRVLVLSVAVSAAIELGQLAISTALGFPHRIADVDDVIVNVAGAMVGYALWRAASPGRISRPEAAPAGR